MQQRNGSAGLIIGLVVVVLVLAGIGLGVFYLVSDPFQTSVNTAIEGQTKWTSENIQADPVGYLTWAGTQCAQTEQKLQASKLALKTKMNQAERKLQANTAEETAYATLFEEAKQVYQAAKAADAWPAELRGIKLEENALKQKIVQAHDKLTNLRELNATYERTTRLIDAKLQEVEGKLTEVTKLKNKLDTDLEIAKVKKSVEGIGAINDRLGAIMDSSAALTASSEDISLESLVTPSGEQRVDSEFDKIMGGGEDDGGDTATP